MFEKKCANDTEQGCSIDDSLSVIEEEPDEWLEETVWYGLRMWHVIFLSIGTVLGFVILLCCCFKFRIPRTKQEIEGDYIRRRIMRKFRKRLKAIQNQELDEMDLKKALDKIRTELKSDTESLQQSDVLSGATLSSAGINAGPGSTYRRASQIHIDISLEDLRIQSLGLGARISLAISRLFRRAKRSPGQKDANPEDGDANNSPDGADKPTTALMPKQSDSEKKNKKGKGEPSSAITPLERKDKDNKTEAKGKSKDKKDTPPTTAAPAQLTTEKETKDNNSKKGNKGKGDKNGKEKEKESKEKAAATKKDKPSEASSSNKTKSKKDGKDAGNSSTAVNTPTANKSKDDKSKSSK